MDESALSGFDNSFNVQYSPELVNNRPLLLTSLAATDAIVVRNRTQVDLALLESAPNLKVIGRLGVGLDNIDISACEARGIKVFPATGANTQSVIEYVIGTSMALVRSSYFSTQSLAAGEWPRDQLSRGGEIAGRTLGLVGFGKIAQVLAALARNLGIKVLAYDPFVPVDFDAWQGVTRLELNELLPLADIVSIHTPLTPDTHRFIDAEKIAQMKQGAILINTSRGEVLDEDAVIDALRNAQLSGAALDVYTTEPLGADLAKKFKNCPNLILTPHIAGVTAEANCRVSLLTVENVMSGLSEYSSTQK